MGFPFQLRGGCEQLALMGDYSSQHQTRNSGSQK